MFQGWYSVTYTALLDLWVTFINFIAVFIPALLLLVVGWFIAVIIGQAVSSILEKLKFNQLFEKGGWKQALQKAELKVNASEFVGAIFKWALFIVFLSVVSEVVGLVQFADFLNRVLGYIPNIIAAVLIFVAAVIISDILEKIIRTAVEGIKVGNGHWAGAIVRWSIWIFAVIAIMRQLLIVPDLVTTLFNALVYGAVAFLVISLGLAFGLGGKDVAAEILAGMKKKFLD